MGEGSSRARMRDGSYYTGQQLFKGSGIRRFCSFCQQHRPVAGQQRTSKGWKCKSCQEKS